MSHFRVGIFLGLIFLFHIDTIDPAITNFCTNCAKTKLHNARKIDESVYHTLRKSDGAVGNLDRIAKRRRPIK